MSADAMIPRWYFAKAGTPAGQEVGPFSWDQLCSLAKAGEVAPADLVRGPGQTDWLKAGEVRGLCQTAATPGGQGPYPGAEPSILQARIATQESPAVRSVPTLSAGSHLYAWVGALAALVIVGAGLGVYFGVLQGGNDPAGFIGVADTTASATLMPAGGASAGATTVGQPTGPVTTGSWTNLDPGGAVPSARDGQYMAYDPTSGKIILFGGQQRMDGVSLGDTWAYDPVANSWTELKPAGSLPPARSAACMTYHSTTGRAICFSSEDPQEPSNSTIRGSTTPSPTPGSTLLPPPLFRPPGLVTLRPTTRPRAR